MHLKILIILSLAISGLPFWNYVSSGNVKLKLSQMSDSEYLSRLTYIGFEPKSNKAREGLKLMLSGDEIQFGLPEHIYKNNLKKMSYMDWWQQAGFLPDPTGLKQNGLPLELNSKRHGKALVSSPNCLSCHAGVMDGLVVAGMPSRRINTQWYRNQFDKFTEVYRILKSELGQDEQFRSQGLIDFYRTVIEPSSRGMTVRGDNPGAYLSWILTARMKTPEKNFDQIDSNFPTPKAKLFNESRLATLSPHPWWLLKYRKYRYWNNYAFANSPMTFSPNLMDHHPDGTRNILKRMDRIRKYLNFAIDTKAPTYTRIHNVDNKKAARGYKIFHSKEMSCFKCHGRHSIDGQLKIKDFPNIKRKNVGTDPLYAEVLKSYKGLFETIDKNFKQFKDNKIGRSYFGKRSNNRAVEYPEDIGYGPPPLVGIWASAPYFHNGSVPTLYGVFRPKERPKVWRQYPSPFTYDHERLGLMYEVPRGRFDSSFYDTEKPGRNNEGHMMAEKLSDDEVWDLIEYMKRF